MDKNLAIFGTGLYFLAFVCALISAMLISEAIIGTDFFAQFDPKKDAAELSKEFIAMVMLMVVAPVLTAAGTVLLIWNDYNSKWYFWSSLLLTSPFALLLPFGTLVFVVTWLYLLTKRARFIQATPQAA